MDKFVVLSTFSSHYLADQCCGALEDQDIPVMLEHVVIHDHATSPVSGFRLLVPSEYVSRASLRVEQILDQVQEHDMPLAAAG